MFSYVPGGVRTVSLELAPRQVGFCVGQTESYETQALAGTEERLLPNSLRWRLLDPGFRAWALLPHMELSLSIPGHKEQASQGCHESAAGGTRLP